MNGNSYKQGAKNHINFRLHVQIDTIKQTHKNNRIIHRNKTNKPVNPSLHKLTGNAHFCTLNAKGLSMKHFFVMN